MQIAQSRITGARAAYREAAVEGGVLKLAVNGGVTVNDATVIQADVEAENGVIHVIDRVLTPAA